MFTKHIILFLTIFSLILAPSSQVFAQEHQETLATQQTQETNTEVSPIDETPTLLELPAEEPLIEADTLEPEDLIEPAMMIDGEEPPSEPGADTQPEQIKPNIEKTNGSLSYQYPLTIPTGRNGLTPSVALSYSSSDTSHDAILGTGWSLNIPSIKRINKKGTDKLYTEDYFTSSIDGELIHQGGTTYTPRTENGNFFRYDYNGTSWTITDKAGTVYEYGTTADSRQDDPSDSSKVFSWYINTTTDTNDNTITYTYSKDMGQIYPNTITYNQEGLYTILFHRDVRSNPNTSYNKAFKVQTNDYINQIEVITDGETTARYDIINVDNLIINIIHTGYDGVSEFEMPGVGFDYESEEENIFVLDPEYSFDHDYGNSLLTGDLNGDGLVDYISSYRPSGSDRRYWRVFMNTDSGFDLTLNYSNDYGPGEWENNPGQEWKWPVIGMYMYDVGSAQTQVGFDLVDINGDGLDDFVNTTQNGYLPGTDNDARVYINNGSQFILDEDYSFNHLYQGASRMGDINGDGLVDYISSVQLGYSYFWKVHINTGSGFTSTHNYTSDGGVFESNPDQDWKWPWISMDFYSFDHSRSRSSNLVDINGDGLADLVDTESTYGGVPGYSKIYINNGSQFVLDPDYNFFYRNPQASKPANLNGDGLIDYITTYQNNDDVEFWFVHINTGSGFLTTSNNMSGLFESNPDQDWKWPLPGLVWYDEEDQRSFNINIVDINGDGLSDIINSSQSSYYPSTPDRYAKIYINTGSGFANLQTLTTPENGTSEFTYTYARIQDESNHVPFPVEVLETITSNDNNGTLSSTTYEYRGADYYYEDPYDKRFAGFQEVIETADDGTTTSTKYHQANGETGNEPTDTYAKIGKVYEQRVTNNSGDLFTRNRTTYIENVLGGESTSIQASSVLTQNYDGTGSHTDTATSYIYDDYGNVTLETQHGIVNGNPDGTFMDILSDTRTTVSTYLEDLANYIVALPTEQTLKNDAGITQAQTQTIYDINGNPTTQSQWIGGADYSTSTTTYNPNGLPNTKTDALGNTTTYSYDSHNMYPEIVTNALGHSTTTSYDYSSGKPIQTIDANGNTQQYTYDGLDRLTEVKASINNGGTKTLKTIEYNTLAEPQYTKQTTYYNDTNTADIYTYIDGFGRTIQTKTEMDIDWLTTDTIYNEMGQTEAQSLPYTSTTSSSTEATDATHLYTTFNYDALGRVVETENVKGITITSYDGFTTSITDALGNHKDLATDAYGNLTQITEHHDGESYETTYSYNTQNLLTTILDAEDNTRSISYDGLGRRTNLEDLHEIGDISYSIWNFSYDDMNLISQQDPNGTTTSYTYDDLHRIMTENNTSTGPSTDISYTYDLCSYGIGKVCNVTSPDTTQNYSYYKQGTRNIENIIIDGTPYTTTMEYNRQGLPTKTINPNGTFIETDYNTRGMADQVSYNGEIVATTNYAVHGRPIKIVHSNDVVSFFSYTEDELYELNNKNTNASDGTIQDLSYTYDNVGNIISIIDTSDTPTAKSSLYTYDDLYRLTNTTVTDTFGGSYSRDYTYTPIGNISTFNGTPYTYTDTGHTNPHAVTNLGGTAYTYDNNGNLTNNGIWNHTWDYKNRLIGSSDGGSMSYYSYNPQGERTKLIEGADTTIYPSSSYELKNGNYKSSISLGTETIATDDNGTLNHIHTDHLGGTNITTNTSGTISQILDYYPYGDTRIDEGSDNETKQYTGYTKDTQTGLSYAGARYYENTNGRFISQDPVTLSLGNESALTGKTNTTYRNYLSNPQTHNSYSYTANNPVMYVDKGGEFLETVFDVAMLGLSVRDFAQSPSWTNAGLVGADTLGVLIPGVPAIAGALKHGDEAAQIAARLSKAGKASDMSKGIANGIEGAAGRGSDFIFKATDSQLQKKFKHAPDFGVSGNYNKGNLDKFKNSITDHIGSLDTSQITGTYRKNQDVIFHVNSNTGLNVMTDTKNNFISGWKLNKGQKQNVINKGKL